MMLITDLTWLSKTASKLLRIVIVVLKEELKGFKKRLLTLILQTYSISNLRKSIL